MKYYIFRNSTIEPILIGIDADFSSYDDISITKNQTGNLIWFYTLPAEDDIENLLQIIDGYIEKLGFVISKLEEKSHLYIFTLELLFPQSTVTSDFRVRNKINQYNNFIYNAAQVNKAIKLIDFSKFISKYPFEVITDWKYYYLYSCVINPKLNKEFIKWFNRQIEAIKFNRKKCVIFDLDNTIWGGIVGEDGPDGIQLGNNYPGNVYLDLQKNLLKLQKEGILLAICSKNNEEDIRELWNINKNMVLKPEHIITQRINWNNKHENILEIAKELNIGLDSIVFIDDNKAERELVKLNLPDLNVPEFPDEIYNLKSFFKNIYEDYFLTYSLTDEDKQKTEQYKVRKTSLSEIASFVNYEDFLKNLNIKIIIRDANKSNISRIAQMTQKTNQFNLTTKRYTEVDILRFLESGSNIYCISVSDKYGDYGITGCAIVNIEETGAVIDTFLLSCRIIGKGIEEALLNTILNELIEIKIDEVKSIYIATPKNSQTEHFFDMHGFKVMKQTENSKEYSLELKDKVYIKEFYQIEREK